MLPRAVGDPPAAARRGRPVRCADLGQAAAFDLDGVPAPDDGLSAITVHGAPDPDEWPSAVFVYGTLQPGHPAWPLLAGNRRTPRRATVAGEVWDTGLGYPALLPDGSPCARVGRHRPCTRLLRSTTSTATRARVPADPGRRRHRPRARIACWTYLGGGRRRS